MADDSIEVVDELPFHPTDSPRGMYYYNMDILTDNQQTKLNDYKVQSIREINQYLNSNPTIRALVAIIYRVLLSAQPRQNVHLTIADYFSKPRQEIEQDVNEYLLARIRKTPTSFIDIDKSLRQEFMGSETDSLLLEMLRLHKLKEGEEEEIEEVEAVEEESIASTISITDEDFMRSLLAKTLEKQLDAIPSGVEQQLISIKDEELDDSIMYNADTETEEFKEKTKRRASKKVARATAEISERTEEEWLKLMADEYEEKYNVMQRTMTSPQMDPERSRKWLIFQMVKAEKQWNLLQIALEGTITSDVQDALRDWQITLIERTQDMSPEKKEAQIDWLEGQMTQGSAISKSILDILRIWQQHILLQGSVMSPALIQTEIRMLKEELSATAKDEASDRIEAKIKQMEVVEVMAIANQDLEREFMQKKIDLSAQNGYLNHKVISLLINFLHMQKRHGLLTTMEFDAEMQVLNDQQSYSKHTTNDTLIAHKKCLEWQLAENIISPDVYAIQRQFINYELDRIGVTNSQMLLSQMNWLQNEMQNNYITRESYENQKALLESRMDELQKVTIPQLTEQLSWLELQFDLYNISREQYEERRTHLEDKLAEMILESKSVHDLQADLNLLHKNFSSGQITDIEYDHNKKKIRDRIIKIKKSTIEILIVEMQELDTKLKAGTITEEQFNERKLDIEAKVSDKAILESVRRKSLGYKLEDIEDVSQRPSISEDKDAKQKDTANIDDYMISKQSTDQLPVDDGGEQQAAAADTFPTNQEQEDVQPAEITETGSSNTITKKLSIVEQNKTVDGEVPNAAISPPKTEFNERRSIVRLEIPDSKRKVETSADKLFRQSLVEVPIPGRRGSLRILMPFTETEPDEDITPLTQVERRQSKEREEAND